MVSAAMAIKDHDAGTLSNGGLPTAPDTGVYSANSILSKEQFPSGEDYALKVRKPYTITKQREKWTDEEHKKFLEALKLYGRAWRRIEEHVGTKTAVQIRSHAQKFFSKVVRENSIDATLVEPIEIPPPRPKRKPTHPYPRKMAPLVITGTMQQELARSSESPGLSVLEQHNQSPISVLSAMESDTVGMTDSDSRNGSQSPVSSASCLNLNGSLYPERFSSPENKGSSIPEEQIATSRPDEEVSLKLKLFPGDIAVRKEVAADAESTQSLKLFGTTVLVTDSQKLSSQTKGTGKSLPAYTNDGEVVQASARNVTSKDSSSCITECTWSFPALGEAATVYCSQGLNNTSDATDALSNPSMPCWAFYGHMPFSFIPLHNPIPIKAYPYYDCGVEQQREVQKEGSWAGSNTRSGNAEGDGNQNRETQSHPFLSKLSDKAALGNKSMFDQHRKGFVPYKRCLAERDNLSSSLTGEEREEQRVRLCL